MLRFDPAAGVSKQDVDATDEVNKLITLYYVHYPITSQPMRYQHRRRLIRWQEADAGIGRRKKYQLRDRSQMPKEERYSPPKEEERYRQQCAVNIHVLHPDCLGLILNRDEACVLSSCHRTRRAEARLAEKRSGNRRYDSRRDPFVAWGGDDQAPEAEPSAGVPPVRSLR